MARPKKNANRRPSKNRRANGDGRETPHPFLTIALNMLISEVDRLRTNLMGEGKKHFTVEEIAVLIARSPLTVLHWIKEGRIGAIAFDGAGPHRRYRIPRDEFERLTEADLNDWRDPWLEASQNGGYAPGFPWCFSSSRRSAAYSTDRHPQYRPSAAYDIVMHTQKFILGTTHLNHEVRHWSRVLEITLGEVERESPDALGLLRVSLLVIRMSELDRLASGYCATAGRILYFGQGLTDEREAQERVGP
jgi:excisionase family DNA binding protein